MRAGRTEYQWPEFLEWWASERERAAREQAAPADLEEARARKMAAEAELAELTLARERGHLVTADDFRRELRAALEPVRAAVAAIPGTWAPRLVGISSVVEAADALKPMVTNILTGLSGDAG